MTKEKFTKAKLPKFNIEGQVHFVTTTVYKDIWLFREEKFCQIIIDNLDFYRKKYRFKLIGYVIIPWHIHLLIQLHRKANDISKVIQFIKGHSAKSIIELMKSEQDSLLKSFHLGVGQSLCSDQSTRAEARVVPRENESFKPQRVAPEPLLRGRGRGAGAPHLPRRRRANYKIWQSGFYDFNIYSEEKLSQKLDYIHNNPVKHDLVKDPADWKYSSYHNYYINNNHLIKVDTL